MPSEDAGGLASLYTLQHLSEYRPAGYFSSLFLNEGVYDLQLLLSGELAQLRELVGKGSHLPIRGVRRFSGIDEIFFLAHAHILPFFNEVKKEKLKNVIMNRNGKY